MNKLTKFTSITAVSLLGFVPVLASAQAMQNVNNILESTAIILNKVVGIVIILALIWFIWGLAEYIETGSGSAEKRKEGRERMVMGAIVFFVIVSIWGIVAFLQSAFGIPGGALRPGDVPVVPASANPANQLPAR